MESRQTRGAAFEVELNVAMDTVCHIIAKAREFDGKSGSTDPNAGAMNDDDIAASVLEDRPSDSVESELTQVIADLSDDAQADLVAMMWLGRDDNSLEDWPDLRQTAMDEHNRNTPAYLIGTPLLADHLESGLDALGLSCADYEGTSV